MPRKNLDKAVVELWQREVGQLSPRNFALRLAASEDLLLRLDLYSKLDKHRGCVNTVSFNTDGDILISGSDDRRVILWDWETGKVKLSFHSGHNNNVFQAKFMPFSDDRSIVTCAADGQVRHAQILERDVETKLLAEHNGRAHKLAIEPGSPHIFYTCGEDGLVKHIDLRTSAATKLFTCQPIDQRSHMRVVHLHAIAIDPRNPNLFAVAGSEEYARLYDIRKYKWDGSTDFGQPADCFCPPNLIGDDHGITGLAFSDQSELLVSYSDEFIYLFTRDMGLGPNPVPSSPLSTHSEESENGPAQPSASSSAMEADEKSIPQAYKGHRNSETVKGVSFFGPKCEYVVSGSDCGRIFIWRKKGGELIRVMEADKDIVNCIESHPHTTVLASSGFENVIKIWTPKAADRATLPKNIEQVLKPRGIRWFTFDGDSNDEDDDNIYFYDDEEDEEDDDEIFDEEDDDDDDDEYDDDCMDDDEEGVRGGVGGSSSEEDIHASDDGDWDEDDCDIDDDINDVDDGSDNFKRKARPRDWMFRLASPEDLMLQLFSLQRRRSNPEDNGENSAAGREILDLILAFNANSDASSDEGEDASAPEDCCD